MAVGITRAHGDLAHRMRDAQQIDRDIYYQLQEEIDWRELTLLPDDQRRIYEI